MKHFRFDVRCIDGRLFRHVPQHDDPDFEIDAGRCEDCEGAGCDRLHRQEAETAVGDRIKVTCVYPPIPDRRFDWCATRENDEPSDNGAMFQGYGRTEQEAIDDLVAVIADARG
jgi:hypothetical protein